MIRMRMKPRAGLVGLSAALMLTGVWPAAAGAAGLADASGMAAANSKVMMQGTAAAADRASSGEVSKEVAASAKIGKDEAVALARKLAAIGEEYTLSSVSVSEMAAVPGAKGEPVWNLYFIHQRNDQLLGSINVSLNGNSGKLVNFYKNNSDPERRPSFPPKTSFAKAKTIAEGYLTGLNPDEMKASRYNMSFEESYKTPLNGDVRYHIRYDRYVNGVAFPQDGLSVDVDGEGDIVSYQMDWTSNVSFADAATVVTAAQAGEAFRTLSKTELSYLLPYDSKSKPAPMIGYLFQPITVDAATGKAWSLGNAAPTGVQVHETAPLTTVPGAQPLVKLSQPIAKDQAIKTVTDVMKLPAGAKLDDATYSEYTPGPGQDPSSSWNIRWSFTPSADGKDASASATAADAASDTASGKMIPNPNGGQVYASVDGLTGELRSYSRWDSGLYNANGSKTAYTVKLDEAKSTAVAFVKKLLPYWTHQLVLDSSNVDYMSPTDTLDQMPIFSFQFKRVIDGVEAGYEGVSINIDRRSGDVVDYQNTISSIAYPEQKPKVLTEQEAGAKWADRYDLTLQYVLPNGMNMPYGMAKEKYAVMMAAGELKASSPAAAGDQPLTAQLVYVATLKPTPGDSDMFLDAVSGVWKQRSNGEPAVLSVPEIRDLDGHWGKDQVLLMVEYGALDVKDGMVRPDVSATRGEMIKMLLTAMNGGNYYPKVAAARAASFNDVKADSAYFAYVETALDRNLIDRSSSGSFNPNEPMTREELAELIVRALGYNQLAKRDGLFQLDVSDAADISRKGQVALAMGLGIMTSSDGAFHPKNEVTRAQAASAFYRFLEARAALTERANLGGM